MSFFQLINLFIILGLISNSYEFNVRNNDIRRRVRDAAMQEVAQDALNAAANFQTKTGEKNDQAEQDIKDALKTVCNTILQATTRMAAAGSQNIQSAQQWSSIQAELRKGINLIMGAYQQFITVHRQSCDSIEAFARGVITKYSAELSAINLMTIPTFPSDSGESDDSRWTGYRTQCLHLMRYATVQRQILPTAGDCISDLMARTVAQRSFILSPTVTRTMFVQVAHPVITNYALQNNMNYNLAPYTLPCSGEDYDNGNQVCANAAAGIGSVTQDACRCQPQNLYAGN
jgi:hypothetical protein